MLKEIELENFKGVGSRCRIPLAPITLLFGANNAGKSTILQALLYTLEVLEHGDADVGRTTLGGDQVDLGGFSRLIHRHNMESSFSIRLMFDVHDELNCFQREDIGFPFPDLEDSVGCAWVEIQSSFLNNEPVINELKIGTPGMEIPLVRLHLQKENIEAAISEDHPIFTDCEDGLEILRTESHSRGGPGVSRQQRGGPGAPRNPGNLIWFRILSGKSKTSALPLLENPIRLEQPDSPEESASIARLVLEMLVLGTLRQLRDLLKETLYVGPLRAIPQRNAGYERSNDNRWSNGQAAWNELLGGSPSLLESTNEWLSRLGVGCTISAQSFLDPSTTDEDALISQREIRRLILTTRSGAKVLPSEVGAGISQVVPVVVAAVARKKGLVLIEQPELHIHPALQVNLGDLFIEASQKRQFIIETHSEHLILRLLRRIRETTEKELADGAPAFTEDNLKVIHIDSQEGEVKVQMLRVDKQGEFIDRWPRGFFAERMEELL